MAACRWLSENHNSSASSRLPFAGSLFSHAEPIARLNEMSNCQLTPAAVSYLKLIKARKQAAKLHLGRDLGGQSATRRPRLMEQKPPTGSGGASRLIEPELAR